MSFNKKTATYINQLTLEDDKKLRLITSTTQIFEVYKSLMYKPGTVKQLVKRTNIKQSTVYRAVRKLNAYDIIDALNEHTVYFQILKKSMRLGRKGGPYEKVWTLKNYEAEYEWEPDE